jgi:hypothetical protein
VSVAHKRIGLSIGFTGARFCSVCDHDLSECPHVPGEFVEVVGGVDEQGRCRVCFDQNCTNHEAGGTYRARVISVIKQAELHEVSFVGKPRQPDARLTAIPIDLTGLRRFLGPRFRPGMRVSCDQCLGECPGIDRPFADGSGSHG